MPEPVHLELVRDLPSDADIEQVVGIDPVLFLFVLELLFEPMLDE